jgi:hypothetical protein
MDSSTRPLDSRSDFPNGGGRLHGEFHATYDPFITDGVCQLNPGVIGNENLSDFIE